MRFFSNAQPNFDFIGKRRMALAISSVLNLAIVVGIALFGLKLGVDFDGGTVVELKFTHPVTAEEVRRRAEAGGIHEVTVQRIGDESENTYLLRMGGVTQLTQESEARVRQAIEGVAKLKSFTADQDNGLVNVRTEAKVDVAQLRSAVEAAGVGVNDIRELGAVVAMVHDVIMVLGYYLVSRAEFNLTSIAALLTVVGYSVNDTIVVYDRVREEMVRFKGKPLPQIINIAVNATLVRTILTSVTTSLSITGLLFFGLGEIRDFAAAMLVGIIVGTYSSIYIASPLTIWLDERAAARDRNQKRAPSVTAPSR